MDIIKLSEKDMLFLNDWGEKNIDKFDFFLDPVSAIKIIVNDLKLELKCFRRSGKVEIGINSNGISYGMITLVYAKDKRWFSIDRSKKSKVLEDVFVEAVGALFFQVMAFMVHGNGNSNSSSLKDIETLPVELQEKQSQLQSTFKEKTNKPRNKSSIIYILKTDNSKGYFYSKETGKKINCSFEVRGHYRRYKSGAVIWIESYKKGEGKKHNKTYKLGVKG